MMERAPLNSLFMSCLAFFLLLAPLSARGNELSQELALDRSEDRVAIVSEVLESWLSGRLKQSSAIERLRQVKASLDEPDGLPQELRRTLQNSLAEMINLSLSFIGQQNPDSEGQRRLFSELNRLTLKRNTAVNTWRSEKLRALKKGGRTFQAWRAWETPWLKIWREESSLTFSLQASMLKDKRGSQDEIKGIVKKILKLRVQADSIPTDTNTAPLQRLALERLTLLARTAEQVARLDSGKSRGSVTRVRRLSRKLTGVSKELRNLRLEYLAKIY